LGNDRKRSGLSRRALLKGATALGATVGTGLPLFNVARADSNVIKVGFTGALSGIRADFGATTSWTIGNMKKLAGQGMKIGSKNYTFDVVVKDNGSEMSRSVQVGNELVLNDKPDIILSTDGEAAQGVGPIADAKKIPTISTMGPWQAWLFGRKGDPAKGFPYSFHFFWGVEGIFQTFVNMWDSIQTNKTVGTFYYDNDGGRAFSNDKFGLPAVMVPRGYKDVTTGLFKIGTDDFSSQVSTFKNAGCDIVSGTAFQDEFATFWNQAAQAKYTPEAATIAAAFLFPSGVNALGDRGGGMSGEVWWTPNFPYPSSLTGQTSKELGDAWTSDTGKQWTQPIGYDHAAWEVGIAALKAAGDPKDHDAVRDAIANLDITTVVGPVKFKDSPIKSVAVTGVAGGQWRKTKGGKFPYELFVVNNQLAPGLKLDDQFRKLSELS
jgi:branched-chain amino acid transport system substrate-binding protein